MLHSVLAGSAEFTGLAAGVADAALFMRPSGAIAIADLFSATGRTLWSGPNAFRSIDQVVTMLCERGWATVEVGMGTTASDPQWASAGALVDDRTHLRRHIDQGDLVGGWVVARRPPLHSGVPQLR